MATYRINYGYKGVRNKLRSGSLIINAKDAKEAQATAKAQLNKELDWYNLTSIKELDTTQSLL